MNTYTPIITPVIIPTENNTNCIIQNNIQFCKKKDLTDKEFGYVSIFIFLIIVWLCLVFKIADWIEYEFNIDPMETVLLGGIGLPLLIIGLILVI